jgi:polyhydroxyalkanoate synthesis regulator phasin
MSKDRKAILSIFGGAVVFALLVLTALQWDQRPVGAAGTAGTAATPTVDEEAAFDAIFARFAARLGTDEATINAAFVGAVSDTADRLVRDGQITAEEAAEVKAMVARVGLKGLVASSDPESDDHGNGRGEPKEKDRVDPALAAAWNTAATMLGIDAGQMKQQFAAGKSLAVIAAERNVDVAQLRTAMLEAGRAEYDKAVRDGAISQAEADTLYADLVRWTDDLINPGSQSRRGRDERAVLP